MRWEKGVEGGAGARRMPHQETERRTDTPRVSTATTMALEDLEDHFKQCYLNGTPAVIVLEDIDIFASREKQVLIYTLLDFMHKKDQLLVVIGTTSKAHLPTLLEKRTASRLNAQFVYVPPASGMDICQVLSVCLNLPIDEVTGESGEPVGETKGEASGPSSDAYLVLAATNSSPT